MAPEHQLCFGADRVGCASHRPELASVARAKPGGEKEIARPAKEVSVGNVIEQRIDRIAEREAGLVTLLRGPQRVSRIGAQFGRVKRSQAAGIDLE